MKLIKWAFFGGLLAVLLMSTGYSASSVKLQDTTGTPRGLNIDASGNLGLAGGLSISAGDVAGSSIVHKFGEAPDFDIDAGWATIWDGSDDGGLNINTYVWPTSASIVQITSASTSDIGSVEIQGLDADYALTIQTLTMTGQTVKLLDTPLIRVFRVKNVSASDWVGKIYVSEADTASSGVPTASKVKAHVLIGNNQTLMAVYTVPAGYTAYMRGYYVGLSKKLAANVAFRLRARPSGQVFQVKHTGFLNADASSHIHYQFIDPQKFTEKTDLILEASTDTNSVGVSGGFDIVLKAN